MTIFVKGTHNPTNELTFKSFEEFLKTWEIFLCGGREEDREHINLFKYINDNTVSTCIKTCGMEISFVY